MTNIYLDLQQILDHWGLNPYHYQKIRDVFRVETNQGAKNLKVSPWVPARLSFVHQAIKHLQKTGFNKMYPIIPTLKGETYVFAYGFAFSLFDWIEGRQCDFKNKSELIQSTKVLADFHRHSFGFTPPEHSNMRNRLGKCLKHFEERYQDLLTFKLFAAQKPNDPFAREFLANVDDYLPMAQKAIYKLKQSSYQELVNQASISKPFCHGDPAARNFILTSAQKIFIIDFDSCRLDLPIMDLIKFTRRVMKKYHWHYQIAKLLMDSYQEELPLTPSELEVIKAVIYFPQKFWRLSIRYFHEHGSYTPERLLRKFIKYNANKANLIKFQENFENY